MSNDDMLERARRWWGDNGFLAGYDMSEEEIIKMLADFATNEREKWQQAYINHQ